MKKIIVIIACCFMMFLSGCSKSESTFTQVNENVLNNLNAQLIIDAEQGIFTIDNPLASYIVFKNKGIDPEKVVFENKGDDFIIHIEEIKDDINEESLYVFKLEYGNDDKENDNKKLIITDGKKEYSLDGAIVGG